MAQGPLGERGSRDKEHRDRQRVEPAAGQDSLFGACRRRNQGRGSRLSTQATGGRGKSRRGRGQWLINMIELTPRAIERVREILSEQGITEGGLRVGVKGGGCSGLSYNLAIDTEQRPGDQVFEKDGVKVFVD